MNARPHIVVVGGGVIGLSIAYRLAKSGQRVTLFEGGSVGRSASWAGAGMLPSSVSQPIDDPSEQLSQLSHRLFEQWSRELRERTGIDNGFRKCGGLYLAMTPAEAATLAAQQFWWQDYGIESTRKTKQDLKSEFPWLNRSAIESGFGAWLLPGDWQIRSPRHLRALEQSCRSLDVTIVEQTRVISLPISQRRVTGVQLADRIVSADFVCIASGAWSPLLLDVTNTPTGIYPVRGQMAAFDLSSVAATQSAATASNTATGTSGPIINEGHRYIVPREDGWWIAGSCEDESGFDESILPERTNQIVEWARGIVPQLQTIPPTKTWSGLRPGSFDGLPYIGPISNAENLLVASGHFRNGLHWSIATAELIYQLVTDQTTSISIDAFSVGRGKTALGQSSTRLPP
jgi:glycine oxidase